MSYLDAAVEISSLRQRALWVLYGKSGSGKTHILSTFPKPMLYLQFGDDGWSTIKDVSGIKLITVESMEHLKNIARELLTDRKYKSVAVDTFSMIVPEWTDENAVQRKKKMSQQMWGDLKTDSEELIRLFHKVAATKIVILTCHEATDTIDGMEDEISPDIRPSVSKGARTYLEGMANFGLHTTVVQKDKQLPDGGTETIYRHAVHLAQNPYYWVKTQKPAHIKLPKLMINPSYKKIMALLEGEKQ